MMVITILLLLLCSYVGKCEKKISTARWSWIIKFTCCGGGQQNTPVESFGANGGCVVVVVVVAIARALAVRFDALIVSRWRVQNSNSIIKITTHVHDRRNNYQTQTRIVTPSFACGTRTTRLISRKFLTSDLCEFVVYTHYTHTHARHIIVMMIHI